MGNLFSATLTWLKTPFTTPMNLMQYTLLVGLTIVLVILWRRVISHVTEGL